MSAQAIAQVASHLNVSPNQIKRCEEWASVLFVQVHGSRPRFVSKKVLKMEVEVLKVQNTWGGDDLMLAKVDGETRVFISRFTSDCSFGGKPFLAKDVTTQAKGMSVSEMMGWHFDTFHRLPLVEGAIADVLKTAV